MLAKKIPTLIILGFKDSGKTSLYQQLSKDTNSKYAFIVDDQQLPLSVLEDAKTNNHKIVADSTVLLPNGGVITLLFQNYIKKYVLPGTFDYIVFVSDSFDSSFLFELLSCTDDMILADLANRISLANMVCVIDSQTIIENLKSTEKLKDRFRFTVQENKNEEDDCCKDGHCTKEEKKIQDDCCKDGHCTKEVKKVQDDCCKDGHCIKEEKKVEKKVQDDCCKDGHCTKESNNNNNKVEKKCNDGCCDHEEGEDFDLITKAERQISTLFISQIQSSHIFLLNKCDLTTGDELDFIEELLGLIVPAKVIRTTKSQVPVKDLLEVYHLSKEYKPINKIFKGLTINNFYQRKPFHPERLFNFLYNVNSNTTQLDINDNFKGIIYLTGSIWLANDMVQSYIIDVIENSIVFDPSRMYYSSMDPSEWNPHLKDQIDREIKSFKYQDRKVELAIIANESFNMNQFIEELSKCLLTDAEMELGPSEWKDYESPFEDYAEEEEEDDEEEEN